MNEKLSTPIRLKKFLQVEESATKAKAKALQALLYVTPDF